jgi:hypothetical protein
MLLLLNENELTEDEVRLMSKAPILHNKAVVSNIVNDLEITLANLMSFKKKTTPLGIGRHLAIAATELENVILRLDLSVRVLNKQEEQII